jgi:hypothetical protein
MILIRLPSPDAACLPTWSDRCPHIFMAKRWRAGR